MTMNEEAARPRQEPATRPHSLALKLLVLLVFAYWVLAETGMCFPQARYLSDRELIAAALSWRARDVIRPGTEDPALFVQQNPDCCKVDRHPDFRAWWDVLAGFNVAEVEIHFPLPEGHRWGKYYETFLSVSACGRPLKSRWGTSSDRATVARPAASP